MASHKDELVRFLETRVFDPIMTAGPRITASLTGTSSNMCRTRPAPRSTASADTARAGTWKNFKRDRHSEPAKKIHQESRALDLPTLNDVHEEFENKAAGLGVGASQQG